MIKVKDLKFKYWSSDRYALDGVNIHFPKGKYTAILGHNGSGKSTLSKILVGILKITSGQVLVNGIEINKHNLDEIRKYIGIIFQNPDNQFVGATVEDDIAFGLENKRMNRVKMRQMILELSEKVGMKEYLDREPLNLSGGQKQRVAIASILALDPEIIIFDEVTSMLDPKGKKEVLKIIRDIQQDKNKTLISITHDMDEAVLADNVVVLAKGKVIAQGTPKEIFQMPEVVKAAKLDLPFIYKLSLQIPGVEPTYDKNELLEKICK